MRMKAFRSSRPIRLAVGAAVLAVGLLGPIATHNADAGLGTCFNCPDVLHHLHHGPQLSTQVRVIGAHAGAHTVSHSAWTAS